MDRALGMVYGRPAEKFCISYVGQGQNYHIFRAEAGDQTLCIRFGHAGKEESIFGLKKALSICEKNNIVTNMVLFFDFACCKIHRPYTVSYTHLTEVEYEPYRNSVAGTIIEITEEYIVVDDSILCKNPTDGITYKVLLNDLCISRYVECGIVKVGDTVQISYEGEIDETSGNTIAGTISVFKATISDGDVLIPE